MTNKQKTIIAEFYKLNHKIPIIELGFGNYSSIEYEELLSVSIPNGLYFKIGFEKYFRTLEDFKQFLFFVKNELLLSNDEINTKSFFQNWGTIKEKSNKELLLHRLIHYFTSYGVGIETVDTNYIYIPESVCDVPDLKIKYIDYCNYNCIESTIFKFGYANIAYSREIINAIVNLTQHFSIKLDVTRISNRELKIRYSIETKSIPSDPDEFIRLVTSVATDSTLYIKNNSTIELIKYSHDSEIAAVETLFNIYVYKYGLSKLAEIFYRNKKIFLAFRHISNDLKVMINKIRRIADKFHKPFSIPKYLQITSKPMTYHEFRDAIVDLDLAHLIKLQNAIQVRNLMINNNFNHLKINIRNGKTFVKTNASINKLNGFNYKVLKKYIRNKLEKNLINQGIKYIKVDSNIDIAIPTSEKQMLGSYPKGTQVKFPKDNITFGVYWKNIIPENCIDLDLNCKLLPSNEYINYGTDTKVKSQTGAMLLHSGDIVCAPNGANEAINISQLDEIAVVSVNLYTNIGDQYFDVDFYLTQSKPNCADDLKIADLNDAQITLKYEYNSNNASQIIGQIIPDDNNATFVLSNDSLSNSNSIVENDILKPDEMVTMIKIYSESYLRISSVEWKDIKLIKSDVIDQEENINSDEVLDLTSSNISKEKVLQLITEM